MRGSGEMTDIERYRDCIERPVEMKKIFDRIFEEETSSFDVNA